MQSKQKRIITKEERKQRCLYQQAYYRKHREHILARQRVSAKEYNKKYAHRQHIYYVNNYEKISKYKQEWYLKNKERLKQKQQLYRQECKNERNAA